MTYLKFLKKYFPLTWKEQWEEHFNRPYELRQKPQEEIKPEVKK